ncbi:MAG: hypothetical protein ACOYOS_04850 [Syntrophales bacterium]
MKFPVTFIKGAEESIGITPRFSKQLLELKKRFLIDCGRLGLTAVFSHPQ